MKDINEYGYFREDEYELLPWINYENRPPFKIWVKPESIFPFFIVEHHPYSLSLLLKLGDGFKSEVFHKAGADYSSKNWEKISKKLIELYEEGNSGIDMFKFDSDEDMFCVYSEYCDDLMKFARDFLRPICDDEQNMIKYLSE